MWHVHRSLDHDLYLKLMPYKSTRPHQSLMFDLHLSLTMVTNTNMHFKSHTGMFGYPLLQFDLECIFAGVGKRVACPACRFPADVRGWVNAMREHGR